MEKHNQTFTGASGRTYTLNFGTNSACRLESAVNRSYESVMAEIHGPSPRSTTIRHWVLASLVDPNTDAFSLDDVGDLIDDIGGTSVVLIAMGSHPETATALDNMTKALKEAVAMLPSPEASDPVTH